MIFIKYLIMVTNLKWLLIITTVIMFMACGIEGSCLTFSRLSCTQGSKRGLTVQNRPETRLIPAMEFNCTGTLVGWTVSGRRGSGTMYPKLQIWRRSSSSNLYFKNGPEIQIDARGSACETITRKVNCNQEFHCRLSAVNYVSVLSGSDFIGVELPPLNNRAFELLFIGSAQQQYVWRREVTTPSITFGTIDVFAGDHLLLSADVLPADTDECLANTDGCDQICINTIGSFQCCCIDGYILSSNGKSCLDTNECTAGTHNCQQCCININGGFLCGCNSGYQLESDGRNCSDINECNINQDCCDQICMNTIGSLQCSCYDGYSLSPDGRSCLDIDECTAGTHNCQHRCININGGYVCGCNSGYQPNTDERNCSETTRTSCLTIGATMGGAIGTPLLLLVILLLMTLLCVMKRNGSKKFEITMQRNEVYVESRIFDEMKKMSALNSPQNPLSEATLHTNEDDNIYASVQ